MTTQPAVMASDLWSAGCEFDSWPCTGGVGVACLCAGKPALCGVLYKRLRNTVTYLLTHLLTYLLKQFRYV